MRIYCSIAVPPSRPPAPPALDTAPTRRDSCGGRVDGPQCLPPALDTARQGVFYV
jgi:hypothetical protein